MNFKIEHNWETTKVVFGTWAVTVREAYDLCKKFDHPGADFLTVDELKASHEDVIAQILALPEAGVLYFTKEGFGSDDTTIMIPANSYITGKNFRTFLNWLELVNPKYYHQECIEVHSDGRYTCTPEED